MRHFILILLLVLCTASVSLAASRDTRFHAPQTDLEQVLDKYIKNKDESVFTKELSSSVSQLREKKRAGTCTEWQDEYRCDSINDDLTCNLRPDLHMTVYNTEESSETNALIEAHMVTDTDYIGGIDSFSFKKENKSWKLDKIDCGGITKFNIPIKEITDYWHPATTAPEKALDNIFSHNNKNDSDLYNFLLNYQSARLKKKNAHLFDFFTTSFLKRSETIEHSLMRETCKDNNVANQDDCYTDRDINPIACAQDIPPFYVYHTIYLPEGDRAVVKYAWPPFEAYIGPSYLLTKERGQWKIDGNSCEWQ